jgi:acyl carrier protein
MLTRQEIYQKVTQTLVESLDVDECDIAPGARLQGDLGAESIDFLDILFRLEHEFSIKIDRAELFPESLFQGKAEFVQDGQVTALGLEELHRRLPFADLSAFEKDPAIRHLGDLFTVDLITRFVEGKLTAGRI